MILVVFPSHGMSVKNKQKCCLFLPQLDSSPGTEGGTAEICMCETSQESETRAASRPQNKLRQTPATFRSLGEGGKKHSIDHPGSKH